MNTLDAIRTRQSIRKFQSAEVPREKIDHLLKAASCAPSAGNSQPWHFVVMTDKGVLAKAAKINPFADMASGAPLAILVCADMKLERFPGNWMLDCSNAAMNILLAAHDMGLGAVWTGVYPNEETMRAFRQLIGAPEDIAPHSFLILGTPDETPEAHARHLEGRIHADRW